MLHLNYTIVFVALTLALATTSSAQQPQKLRVLCYNIHHGRGTDDKVDLDRIAEVIQRCKPDLVALQEVDHKTKRTGGIDQTAALAQRTGMRAQFVKQIDFEGGEYGQALMTRGTIDKLEIHWLPGEPPREQRIVGIAHIDLDGRKLRFCTTHLHHNNPDFRLRQVQEIDRKLLESSSADATVAERSPLTIIAGDFNAEPESAPIRELARSWTIAGEGKPLLTFPSDRPVKQIDYIAHHPQAALQIESIEVIDEPRASDHRPLLGTYVAQ